MPALHIPAANRRLADIAGQTHVNAMSAPAEPHTPAAVATDETDLESLWSESRLGSLLTTPLEHATSATVGPHGGLVPGYGHNPGPALAGAPTTHAPGIDITATRGTVMTAEELPKRVTTALQSSVTRIRHALKI
jgi:hypothetical protein